jgi:cysteinyl-tRNA synthetase
VYFDVEKFSKTPGCDYAKLCPWSVGNETLQAEGEGALKAADRKRNRNDFALWKKSKAGEPAWDSIWGPGRPGWHIECKHENDDRSPPPTLSLGSVMASDILGFQFDIHSGGEDLKFPHVSFRIFWGGPSIKLLN